MSTAVLQNNNNNMEIDIDFDQLLSSDLWSFEPQENNMLVDTVATNGYDFPITDFGFDLPTSQAPELSEASFFGEVSGSAQSDPSDIVPALLPVKPEPITNAQVAGPLSHNLEATPVPQLPLKTETKRPQIKKTIKKEYNKRKESKEVKYVRRLQANRKSAQLSRERKKKLRDELQGQVNVLEAEKSRLDTQIAEIETENAVLKSEFLHLQKMIGSSAFLTKMMTMVTMQQRFQEAVVQKKLDMIPTPKDNTMAASLYLMTFLYSFSQQLKPQELPSSSAAVADMATSVALKNATVSDRRALIPAY